MIKNNTFLHIAAGMAEDKAGKDNGTGRIMITFGDGQVVTELNASDTRHDVAMVMRNFADEIEKAQNHEVHH